MVNNVQMEDQHKSWMKSLISDSYVNELFDRIKGNQEEIKKRAMDLFSRLEDTMFSDPKSSIVQKIAAELMELATEVAGDDLQLLENLAVTDLEEDPWLFPYPFNLEEEKWLEQVMNYFMAKEGVKSGEV